LENFLFKEKKDKNVYPEEINNDFKSYNNNAVNISVQNDIENIKNKKYNLQNWNLKAQLDVAKIFYIQ
jgi:hypothetical protein